MTVTGVSDFYTAGSDAAIVIAAGATSNATDTAAIAAVNDDVDNIGDRSVTVTGTASNDQGVGAVTGKSLTLTDDEATPTATLALSPLSILESGGTTTVTASLNRASSAAVTLTVSASAGTNAAATDFTQTGTTLTIASGETASTRDGDGRGGERHDGRAGQVGDGDGHGVRRAACRTRRARR